MILVVGMHRDPGSAPSGDLEMSSFLNGVVGAVSTLLVQANLNDIAISWVQGAAPVGAFRHQALEFVCACSRFNRYSSDSMEIWPGIFSP